jgi:toxin ParE1/3/4
MAAFRFSRRAEADLLSIGKYTLRKRGKAQTARYLTDLEVFCQTLSDNPALGRACDEIRPGLRRLEHGKHVIFYRRARRYFRFPYPPSKHAARKTQCRRLIRGSEGLIFPGRKSKRYRSNSF